MAARRWTDKQRAAASARIRAQKPWLRSTGPRTEDGKRRASRNARKHGMRSAVMRDLYKVLAEQRRFRRMAEAVLSGRLAPCMPEHAGNAGNTGRAGNAGSGRSAANARYKNTEADLFLFLGHRESQLAAGVKPHLHVVGGRDAAQPVLAREQVTPAALDYNNAGAGRVAIGMDISVHRQLPSSGISAHATVDTRKKRHTRKSRAMPGNRRKTTGAEHMLKIVKPLYHQQAACV
jgi:hypothetical protein